MKRIVLFNGGIKSTFLAALAKKEGSALLLNFDFEDGNNPILSGHLKSIATRLDLELLQVPIPRPPLDEFFNEMLYLILQALPYAKKAYCKEMYYGLSADNSRMQRPILDSFTMKLIDLLDLAQPLYDGKGHYLGVVSLETPLRHLDYPRIIRLSASYEIPLSLTLSCPTPRFHKWQGLTNCGRCKKCQLRKEAFLREGTIDPTTYFTE